jgi:hypothetical protein
MSGPILGQVYIHIDPSGLVLGQFWVHADPPNLVLRSRSKPRPDQKLGTDQHQSKSKQLSCDASSLSTYNPYVSKDAKLLIEFLDLVFVFMLVVVSTPQVRLEL